MAVVTPLRRAARALQSVAFSEVLARAFDRWASALVVRDHGKGAPSYREGEAAAVYKKTQDTSALPGSPNSSAPAAAAVFDLVAFGGCCLYWKPSAAGAATHTSIDLTVWAQSDNGDWLIVATSATLAPYRELVISGTGYRPIFVEVTAGNGGAAGNLDLIAAGD